MIPSGLWLGVSVLMFSLSADLLRVLFVAMFDGGIVKEEVFLRWKANKEATNQPGSDAVLESVSVCFAELNYAATQ